LEVTAYSLAQRFVGLREVSGVASNAHILAMLQLDAKWPKDDAVPWCSAFANWIAWLLRLPRSKSLVARSWLGVGTPVALEDAQPENDVVVLKRGKAPQPGPAVLDAPGHVGFFAGLDGTAAVLILGGNQSDSVNVSRFAARDVLGVRRLDG
jgi:uncharacterized protein (TIGR02594 family)